MVARQHHPTSGRFISIRPAKTLVPGCISSTPWMQLHHRGYLCAQIESIRQICLLRFACVTHEANKTLHNLVPKRSCRTSDALLIHPYCGICLLTLKGLFINIVPLKLLEHFACRFKPADCCHLKNSMTVSEILAFHKKQ